MSYTPPSGLKYFTDYGSLAKTSGSAFTGNLTLQGGNLIVSGNETIDGRHVAADGNVLDAINTGLGIVVRTGTNTFARRTLQTSTDLTFTNASGVAGDPTLSLVDVGTPGTYFKVTTDSKGRVSSGSNPTTLSGFGITDGQPLDADLTALSALASTGYAVRTADSTWATRTLTAGSSKVSVTNGSGVAGNTTVDVVESNLTLTNIGGTLSVAKGGTNLTALGSANQVVGVNATTNALEYKTVTPGFGVNVTHSAGAMTVATLFSGVMRQFVGSLSALSGTTTIPNDNTIPLITEGTQVWAQSITPSSASNTIRIHLCTQVSTQANNGTVILALFRGSTCLETKIQQLEGSGLASAFGSTAISFNVVDAPATTSSVTYSLRVGIDTGTWYFGRTFEATHGGTSTGKYIVEEVLW